MTTQGLDGRRDRVWIMTAVVVSGTVSQAVAQSGEMVAWGSGLNSEVSAQAGQWIAVAAGYGFGFAIDPDHFLVGWGDDQYNNCVVPEPEGSFLAVSGGYWHSLALRSDHTLLAWGHAVANEISGPNGANYTNVVAIAAGEFCSVALRSTGAGNGTIVAWGDDTNGGFVTYKPTGSNFKAVVCGDRFGAALDNDGYIVAWGENEYDQSTPRGTGHDHGYPTEAGFVKIAVGQYHGIALRADGTIECWGRYEQGQAPIPAPEGTFVDIAGTYFGSIAIKSNGRLLTWGEDVGNWPAGEYRVLGDHNTAVCGLAIKGCYANCDGSTTSPILNVADYACFLNRYAAGDLYANCDDSTTAPVVNVLDVGCFLNKYSAGCS